MGWPRASGIALLAAAVGASVSCRQIVGIKDNPPTDLATAVCGLPYGATACASCVQASCCAQSTACAGEVPCAEFYRCVGACAMGDVQCRSQCLIDHPIGGATQWTALATCIAGQCEGACGLTCGGAAALLAPPSDAPGCEACLEANGCSALSECASSPECAGWDQCYGACVTPDCRIACGVRFGYADGGLGAVSSLPALPTSVASALGPGAGPCSGPCATGANWRCVGRVSWPSALAGATLSTKVIDLVTSNPIPAADVSICRLLDPSCATPLGHGQTDASGVVAMSVLSWGLTGGADYYAQVAAPGFASALYFPGYPVSEPQAPLGQPWVVAGTPDEFASFGAGTWDTTKAWVQAGVFDCSGVPAAGVELTIDSTDPAIRTYYYHATLSPPDFQATATGSFAYGGFVNVPPGLVTITATPLALGKPASRVRAIARAGALTNYFMFPTP